MVLIYDDFRFCKVPLPLIRAMKAFTLVVALFVLGLFAVCDAKVWHAVLVFDGPLQAKTTSAQTGVGSAFYESTTQELTVHITHSLASRLVAAHIRSIPAGQTTGPVILPFYDRPKSSKGTIVGSGNPIPISTIYYKQSIPLSVACALITGQSYFNLHTQLFPAGEIRADVPAAASNCSEWIGSEQAVTQDCFEVPKQVLNVNFGGLFHNIPNVVAADVVEHTTTTSSPIPTAAAPPNFGLPVFTTAAARPPSPFDQQPPISNPVIPPGRPGDNCYPNC